MATLPPISFEFFPPRNEEGIQSLELVVKNLNLFDPDFYSVTFGAGGSTKEKTLETVLKIKELGSTAVPHISCISSSKQEISQVLKAYQSHNINQIVALRGDNPSGAVNYGDFKYANELVNFIREETGDHFLIEVAAYPEFHPEALSAQDDMDNFQRKIDAGATGAITQFFFNVDSYFKYNVKQLSRFSANCGSEIPRWLRMRLEDYGDDLESLRSFGVDVITELCETLTQYGVPSIHFYTLNQSGIITKIINNLKS